MASNLDVARGFVKAVQTRDAETAAQLSADDVEVHLPMFPSPFLGKDGVRQMIRMAPAELVQTPRSEEERGGEVRIMTLTRAPGVFANYTTWIFQMEGEHVRKLTFELRAAN